MSPLDRDGAHPAPGAIGCRHQGSHQSKDEGKEGQDQGSAAGLAVRPAWETGWRCGAALCAERGHGWVGEGISPCSLPIKPVDMLSDVESAVAFHRRMLRKRMSQHARFAQVPRSVGEGCWVTMSDRLDNMLFFYIFLN